MTAFTNNSNKALKNLTEMELENRAHKVHGVDGIPIQADSVCGTPLSNTAESASITDDEPTESIKVHRLLDPNYTPTRRAKGNKKLNGRRNK